MTLARSDVSREASWTPPRHATPDVRPETLDARATDTAHDPWSTYWNTLPFRAELCRLEAEDFGARLATVVALQPKWRVLDFGCGFGTITALLARAVGEVCAWDPSPSMRAWAQRNAGDRANVQIVEASSDRRLVGDAEPYDLIVVNSVIQYMSARDRRLWLLSAD
jgi:protein-L-isoaspartate O-methyltransferase